MTGSTKVLILLQILKKPRECYIYTQKNMDYGAEQKANYVNSHTDCNCWPFNNSFIIFIFREVQTAKTNFHANQSSFFPVLNLFFYFGLVNLSKAIFWSNVLRPFEHEIVTKLRNTQCQLGSRPPSLLIKWRLETKGIVYSLSKYFLMKTSCMHC